MPVNSDDINEECADNSPDYRSTNEALFRERARLEDPAELERNLVDLIQTNIGLVSSYVNRFAKVNTDLREDLMHSGLLGLLKAIQTYDVNVGAPFSMWAHPRIKREVLAEVNKLDLPTLNGAQFARRAKLVTGMNDGRDLESIAEDEGIKVEEARKILEPATLSSLDALPVDVAEASVGPPEDLDDLEKFVRGVLNDKEIFVLVRRLGLDGEESAPLRCVGSWLGISREGARKIHLDAITKLRECGVTW